MVATRDGVVIWPKTTFSIENREASLLKKFATLQSTDQIHMDMLTVKVTASYACIRLYSSANMQRVMLSAVISLNAKIAIWQ